MAAIAVPAALSAVGTGIQIFGQVRANKAQAKAEAANAAFLREQADFAEVATAREATIFESESQDFFGTQTSTFAKAGVDIAGSPLLAMAETRAKAEQERQSIMIEGRFNARNARLRADNSARSAKDLGGFANNVLPAVGTVLTVGSSFASQNKGVQDYLAKPSGKGAK